MAINILLQISLFSEWIEAMVVFLCCNSTLKQHYEELSAELFTTTCSHGEGDGTPLQSSCLENPMAEESGGLQSMGLRRVGHD